MCLCHDFLCCPDWGICDLIREDRGGAAWQLELQPARTAWMSGKLGAKGRQKRSLACFPPALVLLFLSLRLVLQQNRRANASTASKYGQVRGAHFKEQESSRLRAVGWSQRWMQPTRRDTRVGYITDPGILRGLLGYRWPALDPHTSP